MGIGLAQLTNSTRWKSGSLKDLRTPNRKNLPAPSAPEYIKQSTLLLCEVYWELHDSHRAHIALPRVRRRREKCYQLLLAVISQ